MAVIEVIDLDNKVFRCIDCDKMVPELSHQCEDEEPAPE